MERSERSPCGLGHPPLASIRDRLLLGRVRLLLQGGTARGVRAFFRRYEEQHLERCGRPTPGSAAALPENQCFVCGNGRERRTLPLAASPRSHVHVHVHALVSAHVRQNTNFLVMWLGVWGSVAVRDLAKAWMEASWAAPSALSDSLSNGRWIDQRSHAEARTHAWQRGAEASPMSESPLTVDTTEFYRHASELLGLPWAAEPKLLPDYRMGVFRNRSEFPGVGLVHKSIPRGTGCPVNRSVVLF